MSDANDTDGGSEYRPTDYLAVCRLSYGVGSHEDAAIINALRYEGPFDADDGEPVEVAVWHLYADSWQSHGLSGPERGAEQLGFTRYEFEPEQADSVAELGSDVNVALSRALDDANVAEEVEGPAE